MYVYMFNFHMPLFPPPVWKLRWNLQIGRKNAPKGKFIVFQRSFVRCKMEGNPKYNVHQSSPLTTTVNWPWRTLQSIFSYQPVVVHPPQKKRLAIYPLGRCCCCCCCCCCCFFFSFWVAETERYGQTSWVYEIQPFRLFQFKMHFF